MINKNLILSVLAILLLSTCKKEKTAEIDVVGTYSLRSLGGAEGTLYSTETTPCMSDNMLVLNSNGSSWAFYKGASPCQPAPGFILGTKDTVASNWKMINGKLFFNNKPNGEITTVEGKLQVTMRDTIVIPGGGGGIIVHVFRKQ